jgi:uncharacterized protein HemX
MDAKCSCQYCNGHIAFESSEAGRAVACPHCGMETMLFVPVQTNAPKPKQITTTPSKPNPPAANPSPGQKELFSIKVTSRAAVVFFALTTLCLALILGHEEWALIRRDKATAVLAAQVQQLQNNLQAEKKSEELLAAQLKQLQNSQQVQNSQFQRQDQNTQFQRPQTIIVRPESQGQHWQHMGLVQ